MATSKVRTDSIGDWLVRVLCAAVAAWIALNLCGLLVSDYAAARFWETWFTPGTQAAAMAPTVVFGLITGVVIGVVIGFVFPHQALPIAMIAAVLEFVAAIVSGAVASSIVLAIGLVFGAVPSRQKR